MKNETMENKLPEYIPGSSLSDTEKKEYSANAYIHLYGVELEGKELRKEARDKVKSLFTHAAHHALDQGAIATISTLETASDVIATLINKAMAINANNFELDGFSVAIKAGKKGYAPISKQPPVMRLRDIAGRFRRMEQNGLEHIAEKLLYVSEESDEIVGENAFNKRLADAVEQARINALSPLRRLYDDEQRAIKEQTSIKEQKQALIKELGQIELAEQSAIIKALDCQALLNDAESSMLNAVGADGKIDPAAIKKATEKAKAADEARKAAENARKALETLQIETLARAERAEQELQAWKDRLAAEQASKEEQQAAGKKK